MGQLFSLYLSFYLHAFQVSIFIRNWSALIDNCIVLHDNWIRRSNKSCARFNLQVRPIRFRNSAKNRGIERWNQIFQVLIVDESYFRCPTKECILDLNLSFGWLTAVIRKILIYRNNKNTWRKRRSANGISMFLMSRNEVGHVPEEFMK